MERINTERQPVRALHTLVEGKGSRLRQKKRWIDSFKEDLTEVAVVSRKQETC